MPIDILLSLVVFFWLIQWFIDPMEKRRIHEEKLLELGIDIGEREGSLSTVEPENAAGRLSVPPNRGGPARSPNASQMVSRPIDG